MMNMPERIFKLCQKVYLFKCDDVKNSKVILEK